MMAKMRSAGVRPCSSRMETAAAMGSGGGDSDLGFLAGVVFLLTDAFLVAVALLLATKIGRGW